MCEHVPQIVLPGLARTSFQEKDDSFGYLQQICETNLSCLKSLSFLATFREILDDGRSIS